VDHPSFRDQLAFSIGFAATSSRGLLHRLLTEHAPDDARQMLAKRVVEHLEQSGSRSTRLARRLGGSGERRFTRPPASRCLLVQPLQRYLRPS
jgi:hypothetical protein